MKPPRTSVAAVRDWLQSADFSSAPIVDAEYSADPLVLDLSVGSLALGESLENIDVARFSELIARAMRDHGAAFSFGRWGERRGLYRSEHFTAGAEARSVHLGIDVFCAAGIAIHAPLDGIVDVVANNARELDYGPLIILRHTAPAGMKFWTLYGHLDEECLRTLRAGMPVGAGERLATVGAPPSNGNWPPHLHFQVILDLLGLGRDFPGVAAPADQERWLALSPNPACFFPQVTAKRLDGRQPRAR